MRKTENGPAGFARLFVLTAYTLAFLCLAGIAGLSVWKGIPTRTLTEDVGTVMKIPPYVGFLTNICVLLWCAASATCLLSYLVLRGDQRYKKMARFFLAAGLFTGFLLLDDFFMFHDYLAGGFLPFPEEVFYVLYLGLMVLFFAGFARTILRTRFPILAAALLCLGLAIGIDHYQERLIIVLGSQLEYLAEEGIKFLGVTGWFSYFVITSVETLRAAFGMRRTADGIAEVSAADSNHSLPGADAEELLALPNRVG